MRFVLGPIPTRELESHSHQHWKPLREPSSGGFSIQVLLLALPLVIASIYVLAQVKESLRANPAQLAALLSFFLLMIPIHELIHAFAYPGGLRSEHLLMGAWPRRGLCYVVFDAPLRRNQILLMLVAPFCVFSLAIGVLIGMAPVPWRMLGIVCLIVHSATCFGDFLTFVRILIQVPPQALVQNFGWTTYWKPSALQNQAT